MADKELPSLRRVLCKAIHAAGCIPPGIFREIVVSRQGAHSCPLASGLIFAVNVRVRGSAGAPLAAYSQALLTSMQARQPSRQTARSVQRHGRHVCDASAHLSRRHVRTADTRSAGGTGSRSSCVCSAQRAHCCPGTALPTCAQLT